VSLLAEFRALDRRVWLLAVARLVVTAGFSMVLPLLAIHLAVERKVAPTTVGLIWTVAGLVGALAQWIAGELVDRLGRRRVLLLALLARGALLMALGGVISAEGSILLIATLIVLNSALRAFFDPVASALVADLCAPEQRVAAFSLQREGINVGWALGNASAALASFVSYGALFFVAGPATLLAMLTLRNVRDVPGTSAPRPLRLGEMVGFTRDRAFVGFLVATLAFFLLQVQLYQSLSIYAASVLHLERGEVQSLYALNGLLVVLLQLPAVAHIRRLGTRGALFYGCLGYAASYAAVGLASGHVSLLFCVAAITLAEIVTSPAQQTAMTTMAPAGKIGAYAGLFGMAQISGQSLGPLLGTAAIDALPSRAAWFLLALFGVGAALLYRRHATASAGENLVARRGKS
jgi:predicted MFS family arabinose efflux permease